MPHIPKNKHDASTAYTIAGAILIITGLVMLLSCSSAKHEPTPVIDRPVIEHPVEPEISVVVEPKPQECEKEDEVDSVCGPTCPELDGVQEGTCDGEEQPIGELPGDNPSDCEVEQGHGCTGGSFSRRCVPHPFSDRCRRIRRCL